MSAGTRIVKSAHPPLIPERPQKRAAGPAAPVAGARAPGYLAAPMRTPVRHMRRALAGTLAGLLVAAAPAVAATTAPQRRADAALERALRALVSMREGPPGAAVVVQRGGSRAFHAAGTARAGTRTAIRPTDRVRIASTSKAYSGAVALALVRAGRLRLSSTIARTLPSLPAAWGRVTLAQALQHTSGLPDYTRAAAFLAALGADPRRTFTRPQLIGYVRGEGLRFRPGTRYAYSNTDNMVVGLMAEAATGRRYASLLGSLVRRPLGLRRTSLPDGPRGYLMPRPYAHGYDFGDGGREDVSEVLNMSGVWASGGIVSTPDDQNAFIRGYASARLFGRAIQRSQLRLVRGSSDPPGPGQNRAGLGIFRYRTRCGTVYGHTGNFPGYTAFIAATLDGRRSVSFHVTTQLSLGSGAARVFSALLHAEELAVCAALT